MAFAWLAASHAPVRADGGTVQLVERHGDYQISVFTAPAPPRAGTVDVSVLVQDVASGQPVPDIETTVTLTRVAPVSGSRSPAPIQVTATRAAATNKLLQSALVELPEQGEWNVQVTSVTAGEPIEVSFTIAAAPPLPRWLSQWVWFSWPALAVGVFVVHRALVARGQQRTRDRATQSIVPSHGNQPA